MDDWVPPVTAQAVAPRVPPAHFPRELVAGLGAR